MSLAVKNGVVQPGIIDDWTNALEGAIGEVSSSGGELSEGDYLITIKDRVEYDEEYKEVQRFISLNNTDDDSVYMIMLAFNDEANSSSDTHTIAVLKETSESVFEVPLSNDDYHGEADIREIFSDILNSWVLGEEVESVVYNPNPLSVYL